MTFNKILLWPDIKSLQNSVHVVYSVLVGRCVHCNVCLILWSLLLLLWLCLLHCILCLKVSVLNSHMLLSVFFYLYNFSVLTRLGLFDWIIFCIIPLSFPVKILTDSLFIIFLSDLCFYLSWFVTFMINLLTCFSFSSFYCISRFSDLTVLVGHQEEHPACKNWVMRCWCGYVSGTRCRLFTYGPADATASQNPVMSCLF